MLAGRGWGKTRVGVEWVRARAASAKAGRIALVGATADDVRDILIEGESGILATSPPWFRPVHNPSKRRLTWPNGAIATTYSAEEPDRLRGKQHDAALADELASWRRPESWDQLMMGLRLGSDPRVVVTTTPRPTPIIRGLLKAKNSTVTRGSTFENRGNLAADWFDDILAKYDGTRLGRQELEAEILDDTPGALWKRDQLDTLRVIEAPDLRRVVVAIDPAVTATADSDETGIVVAGIGVDGHGYVLHDASARYSPDGWARKAVELYRLFKADRIVAEVNNGGDMVGLTVRSVDPLVPYQAVHATRGKQTRAEPIAALYEQGRIHHVGMLARLEDQMCVWDPMAGERSPDRIDALVWALSVLNVGHTPVRLAAAADTKLLPKRRL